MAGERGGGGGRPLSFPPSPLPPSPPPPPSPPSRPSPSPTTPLSNRRRHSGPTADGSLKNSSYMACAKPALAVSNTFGSTLTFLDSGRPEVPEAADAKGPVKITALQAMGHDVS